MNKPKEQLTATLNSIKANFKKNPKESIILAEQALNEAIKIAEPPLIVHANFLLGMINSTTNNYHKAKEYYKSALKVNKQVKNEARDLTLLNNLGIMHLHTAEFEKALEYFLEALKICDRIGTPLQEARLYLSAGEAYRKFNLYDKAIEFFLVAFEKFEKLKNESSMAKCLVNIGIVYQDLKNHEKSMQYFKTAVDIFGKTGAKDDLTIALVNIGMNYIDIGDAECALTVFNQALNIAEKEQNERHKTTIINDIGQALILLHKYDEAEKYLNTALKKSIEKGYMQKTQRSYRHFTNLYSELGDYETALDYHKKYLEVKSEIYKENYARSVAEMQVKYDADKKEKEATINYLRNVELEKRNKLIEEQKAKLQEKSELLYKLAITDKLTQIYNRTYIMDFLEKEFANTRRHGHDLCVIMFDIDNFKKVNDNYGHNTGDYVLFKSASLVASILLQGFVFGRYGGEEFLIIMPSTILGEAASYAEKVREIISHSRIEYSSYALNISISLGVADVRQNRPKNMSQLLGFADSALYEAKAAGKNKAIVYGDRVPDIGQR